MPVSPSAAAMPIASSGDCSTACGSTARSTRAYPVRRCSRTSMRSSIFGKTSCLDPLLDLLDLAPELVHLMPHLRHVGVAQALPEPLASLFRDLPIARMDAVELVFLQLFQ